MQPVLETPGRDGFDLWPVGPYEPYGFLPLGAAMSPADVGTAVMQIADHNEAEPGPGEEPAGSGDPAGRFLHGLLTSEYPVAPGGFRVFAPATGTVLRPGCCNGLEEWRDWYEVLDGDGFALFGHDPTPEARREGTLVRLTPDSAVRDGPGIELPLDGLRRLVTAAADELAAFLRLADAWAADHCPDRRTPLVAALARAVGLGADTEEA
ncbi:hypothetical protein ACIF6L_35210 [Kitasatospora sp. NPDC086009]|uniref:hypothetical protein n=1 Tax=unclassified Kitasatospora TaxID=2633591 RepID=UPI0037CC2CFD